MAVARWGTFKWGTMRWGSGPGAADVSALHDQRDGVPLAYLFVVEGFATAWVEGWYADDQIGYLVGGGGGSWIGTAYGARTIKPGLTLRDPIFQESIDPATGILRDNTVVVTLQDDESDYLATLFRSQWDMTELTEIGTRLKPTDDPAPEFTTKHGAPGIVDVPQWDRHCGVEYIGPAGERRHLYITPGSLGGGKPPGFDHQARVESERPAVFLSENPYQFAGRRCAIYRLVWDPVTQSWPSWSAQYSGGSLIWIGTLLDRVEYRGDGAYRLKCAGSASWQRKRLGLHMNTDELRPQPNADLSQENGNDETWVGVAISRRGVNGPSDEEYYIGNLHTDNRLDPTDSTTWAQQIYDLVVTTVTDADTGNVLASTNSGTENAYSTDGNAFTDANTFQWISVQTNEDPDVDVSHKAEVRLWMHAKVWAAMGWNVLEDPRLSDRPAPCVWFKQVDELMLNKSTDKGTKKSEGYWAGYFTSEPLDNKAEIAFNANPGQSNNGNPVIWYSGGNGQQGQQQLVWLSKDAGQTIRLGYGQVFLDGQLARPPADGVTIGGTAVNAQAWFAFLGKLRVTGTAPSKDPEDASFDETVDHVEVGRCSFVVDANGQLGADAEGRTTIYLEAWEDKRLFGFEGETFRVHAPGSPAHNKKVDPWVLASGELRARQVVMLPGYLASEDGLGAASHALSRLLLSSGTAGSWPDVDTPPSAGDNQPAGASVWRGDAEYQDFGLNIEPDRVDFDAFEGVEGSGGLDKASPINKIGWTFTVPTQSQDLIEAAMRNRGWCMRLTHGSTGPQFGVFAPFEWLAESDVSVALTESDLHGEAGEPKSWVLDQDLRWEAPIDNFSITAGINPVDGNSSFGLQAESRDAWRPGRAGNSARRWTGLGLPRPIGLPSNHNWIGAWTRLHGTAIGQWYAERHFTVRGMWAAGSKARKLYPGVVVSVTDQRVLAPSGAYGVTGHAGYVLEAAHYKGAQVRARILLQARALSAFRYWAPIGEVTGYDEATPSITLSENVADHDLGSPHVDAYGFTETGWLTAVGGTAYIRILQSRDEGKTYASADDVTADIVSVAGNVVTLSSVSGTLQPDTHKYAVLDDATAHASTDWPLTRYSITTDPAGEYSGNQGYQLA